MFGWRVQDATSYPYAHELDFGISFLDRRNPLNSSREHFECLSLYEINTRVLEWRRRFPSVLGYQETSAVTKMGVKDCFQKAVSRNRSTITSSCTMIV